MEENLLFLLPRDRNTGLNNVMQVLARQLNAPVEFVDKGHGYRLGDVIELLHGLRQAKRAGRRVHSSGLVPDVLNRISGRRGGSSTVHNFLAPDYKAQYGNTKGVLAACLHAWALRGIGQVLGCSAAVSRNLNQRYRLRAITCLNGCADCATPSGAYDDQRRYYFAGPLIRRKRVDAAAAAICSLDPLGKMRVFGSGPEENRVIEAMAARPQDLIIGPVDSPAAHYVPGQFYISFASFEGMPLGVLEAFKQGLIPVLSDIPPHAEAVQALGIPELQTFETPGAGVKWATSLSNEARLALARKIRQQALSVFSEIAFARRFKKCLFE
ncbi:glycosyltransferase family protein [Rubrivivax gelatinosus]|uniref:hypothetical protein n=1 Tax=Rubrivivax gelatinosus TaxID=28068 RepID=UPI0019046D98|nr:hypothetical protein [Rubrivivax gelatinosus]